METEQTTISTLILTCGCMKKICPSGHKGLHIISKTDPLTLYQSSRDAPNNDNSWQNIDGTGDHHQEYSTDPCYLDRSMLDLFTTNAGSEETGIYVKRMIYILTEKQKHTKNMSKCIWTHVQKWCRLAVQLVWTSPEGFIYKGCRMIVINQWRPNSDSKVEPQIPLCVARLWRFDSHTQAWWNL